MDRVDKILNICEKSLKYRDSHENTLSIIKKCTEISIDRCENYEKENFDKNRKIININYLLEQKKLDFIWRMSRIFKGLKSEELKRIKKNTDIYEIKRLANSIIKEKVSGK